MKNFVYKYMIAALMAVIILPTSCIEEPESAVEGKGSNRFRPSADGGKALAVFEETAGKFTLVDVWRDVNGGSELNAPATVEFEIDNSILTAYNATNAASDRDFSPASPSAVAVEGSSISFAAGDFARPILVNLNPGELDLSQRNGLGIRLKNPSNGYGISNTIENGEFIVEVIVRNKFDGVYKYEGHIGRYDASCALIELGGNVSPGVSVTLSTTGLSSVSTVLKWADGSTVGGIGSSQTIAIDPTTNAVTVTANGVVAQPANWGPIPGQPNYYDPATGKIYVSYKWSTPCAGALYGHVRHVRATLTPR